MNLGCVRYGNVLVGERGNYRDPSLLLVKTWNPATQPILCADENGERDYLEWTYEYQGQDTVWCAFSI